jgi:hypothetical protein
LFSVEAATEVFRINGKDKFWIVAGGNDGASSKGTTAIEFLTEDLQWQRGPDLLIQLSQFCVVQISDCEFAVIGGTTDQTNTGGAFLNWVDTINVYNFETNLWRSGPT